MKRLALLTVTAALAILPAAAAAQSISDLHVTVVGRAGSVSGAMSEHFLTFDSPVGVPGVGLAPGEYVFKVISPSMMQVSSPDRSKTLALFFVVPTERPAATEHYAVDARRISDGAPPRIEKLFFPNARAGYEFLYPKLNTTANPSN